MGEFLRSSTAALRQPKFGRWQKKLRDTLCDEVLKTLLRTDARTTRGKEEKEEEKKEEREKEKEEREEEEKEEREKKEKEKKEREEEKKEEEAEEKEEEEDVDAIEGAGFLVPRDLGGL
ncbi:MAG: hypothetical protein Q9165_003845 [Trypethelium subeluteriae]